MILKAEDYSNRNELEKMIRVEIGDDMEKNRLDGHIIKGTRKALQKLRLSDRSVVFGMKCIITDTPTKDFKGIKVGQIKKKKKK